MDHTRGKKLDVLQATPSLVANEKSTQGLTDDAYVLEYAH